MPNLLRQFFSSLTEEEWDQVLPLFRRVDRDKGQEVIREGDLANEISFIQSGSVEIWKGSCCIETRASGQWAGNAMLEGEGAHYTFSAVAKEKTVLWVLSLSSLKVLLQRQEALYSKVHTLLSEQMGRHLHLVIDNMAVVMQKQQGLEKIQELSSNFLYFIFAAVACFFWVLKIAQRIYPHSHINYEMSSPLIVIVGVCAIIYIVYSGRSIKEFGLTFRNSKRALIEGFLFTLPWMFLILLLKWFSIGESDQLHQLFSFVTALDSFPDTLHWVELTLLYLILCPMQEFIVRGCLQGSLVKILNIRNKQLMAIILSNLLFATLHLERSLLLATVVFFIGCFWGWMYARHRTLVGVSFSHILIGLWGIRIIYNV